MVTEEPTPTPGSRTPGVMADALAGFLVFLIALPLCLAIARASGFPPIAGIWTAVAGGLICTFISNSQLTIKGPAAGLIVIVAGAVSELGNHFGGGLSADDKAMLGYRLALGIGVASGVIQVLFGLFKAGKLADFFPLTPVHGMLAAIGFIVIAKQAYLMMGIDTPKTPEGEDHTPLALLAGIPGAVRGANPYILLIGLVSLVIMFGMPLLGQAVRLVKSVPAQLIVVIVAIYLGWWLDLEHAHKYLFPSNFFDGSTTAYEVGPRFLVTIPDVLREALSASFALPDFRGLLTFTGLKFLLLFCLIGSLESLLSAKAIDLLDPDKRKTDFGRDLLAIGVANTLVACVGGLPMISEIVRSSANINNGARTRFANLWHGMFLLGFVLGFPWLIHHIPNAALGAVLVYTGFRLASPAEFVKTYRLGTDQLLVFVTTIVVTLATDLLLGIASGIALKVALHLWHGAPFLSLFRPAITALEVGGKVLLEVRDAAVFSNWMGLRDAILARAERADEVTVDLSQTRFVDHSVMEKLHELEQDLHASGKRLVVRGLEGHKAFSDHPMAARAKLAAA